MNKYNLGDEVWVMEHDTIKCMHVVEMFIGEDQKDFAGSATTTHIRYSLYKRAREYCRHKSEGLGKYEYEMFSSKEDLIMHLDENADE